MTKTLKRFELKANASEFPAIKIEKSQDAEQIIRQFYSDDIEIFESFFILLCNRANKTIGWAKISQGGMAGTVVDIKIIAKYAIDSLASSVVLCHNHPSGNLSFSREDLSITQKIKKRIRTIGHYNS